MKFKKGRIYNDEEQDLQLPGKKNDTHRRVEKPLQVCEVSAVLFKPQGDGVGDGKESTTTASAFKKFKVFPENHKFWYKGILDPGRDIFLQWNRVFLFFCWVALFTDPFLFFLPEQLDNNNSVCLKIDLNLEIAITFFRSVADMFYVLNIVVKFQTAYVSPSSRVLGRGELVMDRKLIARRYLRSEFFIDLLAALPLPQIITWLILPAIKSSQADNTRIIILLMVLPQYILRLLLIFPLSSRIIKANLVVRQTAWSGAGCNLLLYMLFSHVLGAAYYLLSFGRYAACLESQCKNETSPVQCVPDYLDCNSLSDSARQTWASTTAVFSNCDLTNNTATFNFGMFSSIITNNIISSAFTGKYLYCLWYGLQNLSSFGQNIITSTSIVENVFSLIIGILGLIAVAHLIGNMQNYLQSLTVRLEEWRLKQQDTTKWMKHRQLPQDLQGSVQQFIQYKWLSTRGVDEDSILRDLPRDLRLDIRRHLCLDLLLRVPFFSQMDSQLLDAICENLVSSLSTQGTHIFREGDPVTKMLFITRGRLESSTTNGGRTGFFNSITLKPGDFCGEEMLAWALISKFSLNLPSSTRTVIALDEVEAFALQAKDLKFVANQFRRLHSKKLQHTFRFYSYHWRTWAASFIQIAWRQHKKRIMAENLNIRELWSYSHDEQVSDETERDVEEPHFASSSGLQAKQNLSVRILLSRFASNRQRRAQNLEHLQLPKLQKPEEPDFSIEPEDE